MSLILVALRRRHCNGGGGGIPGSVGLPASPSSGGGKAATTTLPARGSRGSGAASVSPITNQIAKSAFLQGNFKANASPARGSGASRGKGGGSLGASTRSGGGGPGALPVAPLTALFASLGPVGPPDAASSSSSSASSTSSPSPPSGAGGAWNVAGRNGKAQAKPQNQQPQQGKASRNPAPAAPPPKKPPVPTFAAVASGPKASSTSSFTSSSASVPASSQAAAFSRPVECKNWGTKLDVLEGWIVWTNRASREIGIQSDSRGRVLLFRARLRAADPLVKNVAVLIGTHYRAGESIRFGGGQNQKENSPRSTRRDTPTLNQVAGPRPAPTPVLLPSRGASVWGIMAIDLLAISSLSP
jgi:hypothetical protein